MLLQGPTGGHCSPEPETTETIEIDMDNQNDESDKLLQSGQRESSPIDNRKDVAVAANSHNRRSNIEQFMNEFIKNRNGNI